MKKISFILSLLLVLSMALGMLASCDKNDTTDTSSDASSNEEVVTVESLAARLKNASKDSVSFDIEMSLKMAITLMDESETVSMQAALHSEMNNNTVHITGSAVSESGDESDTEKLDVYMETLEDGSVVTYTKSDDVWEKTTSENDTVGSEFFNTDGLKNAVLRKKTETKDGKSCYVVDASIDLSSVTDMVGLKEEALDMPELSVNAVYYFDKDSKDIFVMEVECGKELGDAIQGMMMESLGFAINLKIDEFKVKVKNINLAFDDTVEIPNDVRENAVDSDLTTNYVKWYDDFNKLTIYGSDMDIREIIFADIMGYRENNDDLAEAIVEAEGYDFKYFTLDDFGQLSFGLENPADEDAFVSSCIVYYVAVTPWDDKEFNPNVTLAGINFFKDTADDLIARFGEPSEINEDWESSVTMTWEDENFNEFTITIDTETGTVSEACVYLYQ